MSHFTHMSPPDELPQRHRLPHLPNVEHDNRSIIQYITVCVRGRRPLLARPEILRLLVSVWETADHWKIGYYMLMPDHLHFFCAPGRFPPSALHAWIHFWRAEATRHWPYADEKPVWQRDFFDRQLRTGESYREKWEYVRQNPARASLVKTPEEWPFQGELNSLMWHAP